MAESKVRVDVGGRALTLSNLEKVIYPAAGFTKGEVVDYYVRVAEPVLAHLRDRPVTRKRWPDGVGAESFFEKNAPRGTPDWVRTALVEHGEGVRYVVVDDLPTLVWAANLAALELHVPQWTVGPRGGVRHSDLLVFDLDPGPPATIVECCRVAEMLRERLAADGLRGWPKTSGNKGAQLYVPLTPAASGTATSAYAKRLAAELSSEHPDLVVATMSKQVRPGKVYIDWSQNNPAKTTIAPYSLRGTERPQVSTPLDWSEVASARRAGDLVFAPGDVVERVEEYGDLLAPMRSSQQRLPAD